MISENSPSLEKAARWSENAPPVILTIVSPLLVFFIPYLPMTDFPQHFATLSIICHIDDPSFGFSQYYELDYTKSLYILPYLVAQGLAMVMPVEMALRFVVYLSMILYPLGLLIFLRSQGKSASLALLAIPLVYNLATFFGLFNFNIAIGTAFFAFYFFSKEYRSLRDDIVLTLLCVVLATTHLYGTALILGYATLWSLFGKGKITYRRYLPLLPCLIAIALWFSMWKKGLSVARTTWTPFMDKIIKMENAVLGGYQDWSETWILSGFVFIILLFLLYAMRLHKKSLITILRHDRIISIYIVLNFLAYLALPLHIPSATFIHPRHILLVFCFLPLVVPDDFLKRLPILGRALLLCLALSSVGNAWFHFYDFNREARVFDTVIEKVPMNQRVLQLTFDIFGGVMATAPYLHFLTYIQAKKGGIVATGFAQYIWTAPIKMRDDVEIPLTAEGLEYLPQTYDYKKFGYYYNYILVRGYPPAASEALKTLPFQLIHERPPWRLFRSTKPKKDSAAL